MTAVGLMSMPPRGRSALQRLAQRGGKGAGGVKALLRLFGRRLLNDRVHRGGQVGPEGMHQRQRFVDMLVDQGRQGGAREGLAAGQEFKREQAQGVDVGLWGDRFRQHLLRGDVGGRAEHGLLAGQLSGRSQQIPGDAEVGQVGVARFVQQNVGRLQVAVDHAVPVGVIQGAAKLIQQAQGPWRVPRALRQRLRQVAPPQPAHDQIGAGWIAPVSRRA